MEGICWREAYRRKASGQPSQAPYAECRAPSQLVIDTESNNPDQRRFVDNSITRIILTQTRHQGIESCRRIGVSIQAAVISFSPPARQQWTEANNKDRG